MKKALVLVLALVMALVSVSAVAEAAYSYADYTYDESLFAEVGGDWFALDGLGIQLYIPDAFVALEVTEEQAAQGTVALLAAEDGSAALSIDYTVAADDAGNGIATIEDLAAVYTAAGAANVDVVVINGIPAVTYLIPDQDFLGYAVLFGDATQCSFSFGPASDSNLAILAGLTMSSLMEVAA